MGAQAPRVRSLGLAALGAHGGRSAPKGSLWAWVPWPFLWGSAGTSCPQLLDGITTGWSPGAPRQVLQAARAQGSYQSSARSWWRTQGWPHVRSRGPRYRVKAPRYLLLGLADLQHGSACLPLTALQHLKWVFSRFVQS